MPDRHAVTLSDLTLVADRRAQPPCSARLAAARCRTALTRIADRSVLGQATGVRRFAAHPGPRGCRSAHRSGSALVDGGHGIDLVEVVLNAGRDGDQQLPGQAGPRPRSCAGGRGAGRRNCPPRRRRRPRSGWIARSPACTGTRPCGRGHAGRPGPDAGLKRRPGLRPSDAATPSGLDRLPGACASRNHMARQEVGHEIHHHPGAGARTGADQAGTRRVSSASSRLKRSGSSRCGT